MICIWQVFGGVQDFTSIADTLIFEFGEITTICGRRVSSAKVWIKVCNMKSSSGSIGLHIISCIRNKSYFSINFSWLIWFFYFASLSAFCQGPGRKGPVLCITTSIALK